MQTPIYVELFKIKDFKKFDRIVMININSVELWIYYGQSIKVSAFERRSINDTGYKSSINLGDTYIINWGMLDKSSKAPKKVKDKILETLKRNLRDLRKMVEGERILVIANPPYSIAGPVTKAVLEILKPDEYINLMPANDYKCGSKNNRLYNHVKSIEMVPDNIFEDAVVTPSLASLSVQKVHDYTDDEFELMCYNSKYKKFYEENIKREITWKRELLGASLSKNTEEECRENLRTLNNKTAFMLPARTVQNGTHKTKNCHDYRWNIEKSTTYRDIPIGYNSSMKKWYPNVGFIYFNNETEFNNFCTYWYRGNLSNKLIKGLNKTGGSWKNAIPRIDWNRPWTDEEILKEYKFTEEEIKDILA